MPEFRGTEDYNLDDKGRLMIPSRFRKKMSNQNAGVTMVLMRTLQGSIEVYEPEAWVEMQKRIDALSDFNPKEKQLKTVLNASVDEAELDKQGRITFPKRFLENCGMTKEVTLIGEGNRIAVWNPEKHRAALNVPPLEIETLLEKAMM
jgi:MraZ protein